MVSFLFLLARCEQDQTKKIDNEEGSFTLQPTEQYGRGAKSDGQDTNSEEEPTRIITNDSQELIVYFSRSGNTENLAHLVHRETNADSLELSIKDPYPADYEETVERADQERETGQFPELDTDIPDLSQYKRIYLGYPIWSMTLVNPMIRFLQDHGNEIDGKEIVAFSTSAGYGEGQSVERIQELLPNAKIISRFSIEDSKVVDSEEEILDWLRGI
ncbi:hypothetical protein RV10_GL002832 [Enterococcus pallens]|nr:hypothetical protein RV10_GL002832 [Enterococcus pallens]